MSLCFENLQEFHYTNSYHQCKLEIYTNNLTIAQKNNETAIKRAQFNDNTTYNYRNGVKNITTHLLIHYVFVKQYVFAINSNIANLG